MSYIYELIGFTVVMSIPGMLLIYLLAWGIELSWVKFQIPKALFEYIIYRKQFHKWRKENKDMRPDGSFPAN